MWRLVGGDAGYYEAVVWGVTGEHHAVVWRVAGTGRQTGSGHTVPGRWRLVHVRGAPQAME